MAAVVVPRAPPFAVIVAEPGATPVTVTVAALAPVANFAVCCTVAMLGLSEDNTTVVSEVAGLANIRVNVSPAPALTVRFGGLKLKPPPPQVETFAVAVAFAMPDALAVIVAEPAATP